MASLVDETEMITIGGFYDNVAPVSDEDMELLNKIGRTFDEKTLLKEMNAFSYKQDLGGLGLLNNSFYMPVININGIHAGYTGKGTKTVLPKSAMAKIDIRFGPNMEPDEVIEKIKAHLAWAGYEDIEIKIRDNYTWSKTEVHEEIVQKFIGAYKNHGRDTQIWPMATWAAPYFVFSRVLNLPVVSGGLGHGGRQHSHDEYMTIEGFRDFEKFVTTFLYELSA